MSEQTTPDPIRDWPPWWFSRLETAIERGDLQVAAEAQIELKRLGVRLHYGRPNLRKEMDRAD